MIRENSQKPGAAPGSRLLSGGRADGAVLDALLRPRSSFIRGMSHDRRPSAAGLQKGPRKSSVAAVFAFLLLWCAASARAEMSAREYWIKGTEYAKLRLSAEAIEHFTKAIRLNRGEIGMDDIAMIFNDRGLVYAQTGRDEDAIGDFSNALRINGRNPVMYNNRGLVYLGMEDYRNARDDFGKAISLGPKNASSYFNRGRCFLTEKRYEDAVKDFSAVLEIDPRHGAALYNRGTAYKNLQLDDQANRDFDRVIELNPAENLAYYQKAGIFARTGKIDVACVFLEEAVGHGFSDVRAIDENPDFAPLRKTDCYRALMRGK